MRYEFLIDGAGAIHEHGAIPSGLPVGPQAPRAAYEGAVLLVCDEDEAVIAGHIERGDVVVEDVHDGSGASVRRAHVVSPGPTEPLGTADLLVIFPSGSVAILPRASTASMVRAEAQRRIYARYPLHVQLNMQARATELLLIGPERWTAEQVAEADAIQAARDWVKAIRAASNAMEPLPPADYAADVRWEGGSSPAE